jgi:hypothetical protein
VAAGPFAAELPALTWAALQVCENKGRRAQ